MKNGIADLRDHLFATLEGLRDKKDPMDIERAKAIAGVAQVIVNSANAENDFVKITGGKGSGFIPNQSRTGADLTIAAPRELSAGEARRNGRPASKMCPDPNCGGFLTPRTDGNGGLKDVCDKCHRTVSAA